MKVYLAFIVTVTVSIGFADEPNKNSELVAAILARERMYYGLSFRYEVTQESKRSLYGASHRQDVFRIMDASGIESTIPRRLWERYIQQRPSE